MMDNLQIFSNPEFGSIRTVEEDGQIWFCGKDIAMALAYKDTPKAIKAHCREDGWAFYPVIDDMGRTQQIRFINEPNLYRLITHSKLPAAEQFEKWIFEEVLPAIRRTGEYQLESPITEQRTLTTDDYIKAASLVASCRNERLPYVLGFLEQGGFNIPEIKHPLLQQSNDDDVALIGKLINQKGISLNTLSKMTNICKASLSYYKNGKHKPSPERYAMLIEVLS